MASNGKEIQHECRYTGAHETEASESLEKKPPAPSDEFARMVALQILGGRIGRYRTKDHFRKRMVERGFDVLDMEYVIRNGTCVENAGFIEEFRTFKYTFRGCIDGTDFDAAFALSADHDFVRAPLMILITGVFKTANGARKQTY